MNLHTAEISQDVLPEFEILGVSVARVGWNDALAALRRLAREKQFTKITFLNAHNANVACVDADFAGALGRFLVLPDGVGVDIAARLLYGDEFPANLNGTDFIPGVLKSIENPLTIGLLGATRRNVEAAASTMSALASQHKFVVVHDGYFTNEEEPVVLDRLAAIRPDILLVAMGVPIQELWIDRNLNGEHCTMAIGVGALFDFMSGAVSRAPVWMRRLRLEWLYRLLMEPGRLWRRYVVGNPLFLARVLRQKFTRRGRSA